MQDERLLLAKSLVKDQPDEAMRICNDVMNEEFDSVAGQQALFMGAYIMMEAERYGIAYQMLQRCAALNPDVAEIYTNMGMCLEEHDAPRAIEMFQKAYKIKPNHANAIANEGLMRLLTGEPQKCIDLSQKALSIDPTLRSAQHNTGLAQLMLKQWPEGWRNYYETMGVRHREKRDYGLPEWDGKSPGQILVYGEQGVGDEIMFASCLPDVLKTNDVVLDTDSRLKNLFERSFEVPTYGTRFCKETPLLDEQKPDYQLAIGQLPHFYRNHHSEFPGTRYLRPDDERCIQWRALFDTFKGRKIGIAWRGGLPSTGEKRRSLDIENIAPLFNDKDTFISLEYKDVPRETLEKYDIKSYPRATAKGQDIDDLAALVNELDLVITSCTTVVYIAGALGKPCYVLVPDKPGYRYGIEGGFPWYNTVDLYRKRKGQSWRKVINRLKSDLDL